MEAKNTTFWSLIKESKINIPIIQRDYAQGRIDEKERRNKFLNVIFEHLNTNIALHLDFVYGRLDRSTNTFFPIDGQQRLTTLFLIYWYFSIKEAKNEEKCALKNFTYDTRISTREFCKALIENEIIIPSEFDSPDMEVSSNIFINKIKDSPWFRYGWENDPTISAMLVMIQSIQNIFNNMSDVWEKLVVDNIISFEVLDLGAKDFELTDELYIKMNARGKQLSDFENFKADFIRFIDEHFKNKKLQHPYEENKEISYCDFFAFKIEKEWTDLFWAFRDDRVVIDEIFMNYLSVITQLCYFKDNTEKRAEDFNNSLANYQNVFMSEENLLFLFDSLDMLYKTGLSDGCKQFSKDIFCNYFEKTFLKGAIDDNYNEQVRLFWNDDKRFSLFEQCINEGLKLDVRNKIILFAFICYRMNMPEGNERHYIRVVRNLIQATRQRNDTKYNMNIRINEFGNYWKLFKQLQTRDVFKTLCENTVDNKDTKISEDALNNEKNKALLVKEGLHDAIFQLEEFRYFGGLLHSLDPITQKDKLSDYAKSVREIWNNEISDTLIIRALIASDFGGVYIKNGGMGEMWYFGKTDNWTTVLTSNNDSKNSIVKLLDSYLQNTSAAPKEKLESIINEWHQSNASDRSWKHYFMTYDDFYTSRYNYFAWRNDYEIRMLGSEGSSPLLAYHISPYVKTVCQKISNKLICDESQCYQQYSGNSPLYLKNGITLTCTESGWKIEAPTTLPSHILSCFNISEQEMLLKESIEKDRIEIAVDFCNHISIEV